MPRHNEGINTNGGGMQGNGAGTSFSRVSEWRRTKYCTLPEAIVSTLRAGLAVARESTVAGTHTNFTCGMTSGRVSLAL